MTLYSRSAFDVYGSPSRLARPQRITAAAVDDNDITSLLAQAHANLDRIEDEVDRLRGAIFEFEAKATAGQLAAFFLGGPLALLVDDPFAFQQYADEYKALVLSLEEFVRDVFGRVEKKALAGDLDAARRLRDSSGRIAGAAATADPRQDRADNIRKTVDDAKNDLASLVEKVVKAVGVAGAIYVAVNLLNLLFRR